jgi:ribosomal protein S18 acetylase RimI-like enzyme
MAIKTRDLTRDWRRGDDARLARLMNESGRGWPGGGWDPKTPEEAARRVREQRSLGVFVSEEGGEFISLCSLYAKPNERNRAYVGFLTAHPDYHGKGYGKAVLLRAVERVRDMRIPRVDLHTWPGNLKAVPLYKKSGFMWSPESGSWGVYMQNFTPGARLHPIAQAYFRKHDWYRTMKRDLALEADEHKRGKVRVYVYEWEEDGDRLRMVYDRQSWGLLEIETNDFRVGCTLDDEKLVAGLPQRIRWEIVNHRPGPLEVALIASADPGIALERKEILRVKRRAQAEAEFTISPEIKEKEEEPRAPVIRTDLLVDGVAIALAAGFQAEQAVSFGLDGDGIGLRPARPERVALQATSALSKRAFARLRLSASGAKLEATAAAVGLSPKGTAETPVTLTAPESGPVLLRVESEVRAGKQTVRPKAVELYAHALMPGEVVGHVEEDRVCLESATLRVRISRRGGWTGVIDKVHNRWDAAGIGVPQLGPPFAWEEFFETRCEARLERQPDRLVAVLRSQSVMHPGVWLERRIAVSNLPVIEVSDTLINGSQAKLEGRARWGASFRVNGGAVYAPLKGGVVRGPRETAGRQLPEHHLSEEGADWPEGWCAVEGRDGEAMGLVWGRCERIEYWGGWTQLERSFEAAAPGQSTALPPVYVVVADGSFAVVRRWWQQLFGPRVDREQRPPATRPPLQFGLRPRVVVVHGPQARARLQVDSVGQLELSGKLSVVSSPGLRVSPRRASFAKVCEQRPSVKPARLSRSARTAEGAYSVETTATLDRAVYHHRQPVVVLGDPEAQLRVRREGRGRELLRISNGVLALTIAADFQGSAISLMRDGEELLRSAYPEGRPLAWESPWLGGISPGLNSLGRDLFKERFRARELTRRGDQGVRWQGVRVSCAPKQDRGRHEAMALDYLLAPGSSILALVLRTTRRAGTAGWMGASFSLWPVMGGSHLDAVLTGGADPETSRLRREFGGGLSSERWVIAENPRAGQAVVLVALGPQAGVDGVVYGEEGYRLGGGADATHEAFQTRESVFLAAFTQSPRARELAEALAQLENLP